MKILFLKIDDYKNLKNFDILISEDIVKGAIIGNNSVGKSNFFEAIILIFKNLDLKNQSEFGYELIYHCKKKYIYIKSIKNGLPEIKYISEDNNIVWDNYDNFICHDLIKVTKFDDNKKDFLPNHIFTYYSGVNPRIELLFDDHQRRFYNELLEGNDLPFRYMFFAIPLHAIYVLLAFYGYKDDTLEKFLEDKFDIVGFDSVLFKLHTPYWFDSKRNGNDYFWGARGIVRKFIDDLYNHSFGQIKTIEKYKENFRSKTLKKKDVVYLYIKDLEKLRDLSKNYENNSNFFKMLESTYISDLIDTLKINILKKDIDGKIHFKELSEGEQQLLTVIGLLKFTKDDESLILLDEPDTHLNPKWKYDYIDILNDTVGLSKSTQILITSHDPLVVGGLNSNQVFIFSKKDNKTIVNNPDFEVKGLGVAGILTSELFDLPTTLDSETNEKLKEMRKLQGLKLRKDSYDIEKLNKLELELSNLGISKTTRDPLYENFLKAITPSDIDEIYKKVTQEQKVEFINTILNRK